MADDTARAAVKEVLLSLGLDAEDPIEIQEQFAALRALLKMISDPEFKKDMEAVRSWRETQERVRNAGIVAAVGTLVAAFFAGIGWAVRAAILALQHGGGRVGH